MELAIYGITPFTLQDFPNHVACIFWFGGCNMRCVYCHNPELVFCKKKKRLLWKDIYQFLQDRRNLLEGVVLSGGECTLSPKLLAFIKIIRELGYKVKLDTNGLRPDMLDILLSESQIDYVALDYKAPERKFLAVTGSKQFNYFRQSLIALCRNNIPFEVRTTVHTGLLNEEDISDIIKDLESLNFRGNYFVQNFQSSLETIELLPKQLRELDIDLLPSPRGFKLHTRNFLR